MLVEVAPPGDGLGLDRLGGGVDLGRADSLGLGRAGYGGGAYGGHEESAHCCPPILVVLRPRSGPGDPNRIWPCLDRPDKPGDDQAGGGANENGPGGFPPGP